MEGFEIANDDTSSVNDNSYMLGKVSGGLPKFFKLSKVWEWIQGKVNTLLGNQTNYNLVVTENTGTDYSNNCIPELNKTVKYITRGKDNQFGLIEAERTKNLNVSTSHYCSQKFYLFGSNKAYQRLGSSTDSGTTWTWTDWLEVINETSLNSALSEYGKHIYTINRTISSTAFTVDLTDKVATRKNYRISVIGNYVTSIYYDGIFSVNFDTKKFNIIKISGVNIEITSTDQYKLTIKNTFTNATDFSVSITEC